MFISCVVKKELIVDSEYTPQSGDFTIKPTTDALACKKRTNYECGA